MQNTKASVATDLVEISNVNFHKPEVLCPHCSKYYHQGLLEYDAVHFGKMGVKV
jgi:transposase-like protein